MIPKQFFSNNEIHDISRVIQEVELNTSGIVRIHIESYCKGDPLDRAAYIFNKLDMQNSEFRNGVLLYLAINDRKFSIIGDAGINMVTSKNFWDDIKDIVFEHFNEGRFAEGISEGILIAGEALNLHFPA